MQVLFTQSPTHSQDFTEGFKKLVNFPIFDPVTGVDVLKAFKTAQLSSGPVMIVERKSRY